MAGALGGPSGRGVMMRRTWATVSGPSWRWRSRVCSYQNGRKRVRVSLLRARRWSAREVRVEEERVMADVTEVGYDLSSSTWRMHPARTSGHIQRAALRALSRQTHETPCQRRPTWVRLIPWSDGQVGSICRHWDRSLSRTGSRAASVSC